MPHRALIVCWCSQYALMGPHGVADRTVGSHTEDMHGTRSDVGDTKRCGPYSFGFTFGFAGPGWAREQQLRRRINTERPLHTTLIRRWHSVRRAGEIAIRRAAHTAMYVICVRGHTCIMRGAAQRGRGRGGRRAAPPPRARASGREYVKPYILYSNVTHCTALCAHQTGSLHLTCRVLGSAADTC